MACLTRSKDVVEEFRRTVLKVASVWTFLPAKTRMTLSSGTCPSVAEGDKIKDPGLGLADGGLSPAVEGELLYGLEDMTADADWSPYEGCASGGDAGERFRYCWYSACCC